jgi:hypothetical protein
MAATGYTPISLYYSSTTGNTPTAGNLVAGELAINTADGKLFYKDSSGVVQIIASKTGVAAGSNTQVQYNSSGSFAGSANMTFNGTSLTLANDASISGLTVGKGGGSLGTNTAFGVSALAGANSTTGQNTAIGYNSLTTNTTGYRSVAVGYGTLQSQTSGYQNNAIGWNASNLLTTGIFNDALGYQTLQSNNGSYNVGIGGQALYSNTTASRNTAVGYQAGYANTTGHITALGSYALQNNTTGNNNVGIGGNDEVYGAALQSNTTGNSNVAVGGAALSSSTTASNNTAAGYQALYTTTTSGNTAFGYQCLYSQSSGGSNVAMGYQAGYNLTTGNLSTFVGYAAGNSTTGGSGNTMIGTLAQPSSGSGNYQVVVTANGGSNVFGKGDSTGFINPNGGGVYQGNNSATWSITSDVRLKKNIVDNTVGLSAINAIQVRNFEYRTADEVTDLPKESAIDIKGVQLGAIAQELKEILPDCVKEESTGVMSVDTTNLTWYLINAVKELNAKVTALEAQLGNK